MSDPPDPRELVVRAAWEAGEFDRATESALRSYGGEIFGFLIGMHRDQDDADDAFSKFAERLWSHLPRFAWKSSLRTWLYLLARSASSDVRRDNQRARGHRVELSSNERLSQLAQKVRTETLSILRTEKRTAFEELKLTLSEAERELLILRASRNMPWRDIALVLSAPPHRPEDPGLEQESARLRKRYQLLKAKLRDLGKHRGLL
jgi:RNA polymerase sigma-70 factor, ECF subfamily